MFGQWGEWWFLLREDSFGIAPSSPGASVFWWGFVGFGVLVCLFFVDVFVVFFFLPPVRGVLSG